jgi:integrase
LKWLAIRDDVRAGRTPRPKTPEGLTVRDLVNRWLTSKQRMLESGELAKRTMINYRSVTDILVGELGERRVDDLAPDDFQKLRSAMARRWGPLRLMNAIVYARGILKFAFDNGLIDKPVRYGTEFERPSARTIRKSRNANGPRMFRPEELRAMLSVADPTSKVALLLGINCGMGPADIAKLPMTAVDIESAWLLFPRGKTGVDRKVPLWPETVKAIRDMLVVRPKAKPGCAKFLLLTRDARQLGVSSVGKRFTKIAELAGVKGRVFYDCRRTVQTVGEESRDLAAVQAIMGHVAGQDDMSATYRQRVSDERLRAVTETVRNWLFSEVAEAEAG